MNDRVHFLHSPLPLPFTAKYVSQLQIRIGWVYAGSTNNSPKTCMKYPVQAIALIASFVSNLATVALGQTPLQNSPDRYGDYYRNEAPLKGTTTPPLAPGSLWEVIADQLNCRSAPDSSSTIVKVLNKGDIIQVEVGRGGSDEVLMNSRDASGKPWMPVRGGQAASDGRETRCYVRANSRYIQPYASDR